MDPSAWIALAGLAFAIVATLLALIAKAAWTVSRTVTKIEGEVSTVKNDTAAVKSNVRMNGEAIVVLDTKMTDSLRLHEEVCDPHRQELDERIVKLEGA